MFFSCLEAVDWRSIERPALFLLPTRTIELSKRLQACGFILTVGNCANSELCETIESTWCLVYTPSVQHGNIEPEHLVLEKEILFSGSMLNFRGVSLLPDSPCFCWKRKRFWIQGYEHLLEQIARIPRLGSLNLACGGAELVVLHTFDSVASN